jgi:hypothetical protein
MPIIIDENGRRDVTQEQYDDCMAKLPPSKPDFEAIADAEVAKVFESHWYVSIGEVSAYASFPNPHQGEAKAILLWYAELYDFVENNQVETEQGFIDLMPKYNS